jgi:hypothetical protein
MANLEQFVLNSDQENCALTQENDRLKATQACLEEQLLDCRKEVERVKIAFKRDSSESATAL